MAGWPGMWGGTPLQRRECVSLSMCLSGMPSWCRMVSVGTAARLLQEACGHSPELKLAAMREPADEPASWEGRVRTPCCTSDDTRPTAGQHSTACVVMRWPLHEIWYAEGG